MYVCMYVWNSVYVYNPGGSRVKRVAPFKKRVSDFYFQSPRCTDSRCFSPRHTGRAGNANAGVTFWGKVGRRAAAPA